MRFIATPLLRGRFGVCFLFICHSFLIALCGSLPPLAAQSLSFFNLDATNFPRMRANVYAFDAQGRQINSRLNFNIAEDGVQRAVANYDCPMQQAKPVSAVLTIDISGSMGVSFNGTTRLEIAKSAASAFVDALATDGSECGIVAFETNSYPFQDFTTDKTRLKQVIGGLTPLYGTNYQAAFLSDVGGALPMLARAKNTNRAVIFLTDGLSTAVRDQVIQRASQVGATVYCITIGFPVPQILDTIARASGGVAFSNVQSSAEAVQIYRELANRIRLNTPCAIEWTTDLPCRTEARSVVLTTSALPGVSAGLSYVPPVSLESQVSILPRAVAMGSVAIGQSVSRSVSMQLNAGAQDLVIRRIRSNDNTFRVLEQNVALQAGQPPRSLTVQYTAQDSGYRFATLTVETDNGCTFDFYATSGFPGVRPAVPNLRLTHPNGGESFLVGTDTVITWTGLPPTEEARLDYSIDAGKTWIVVDTAAKNLRRPWHVPNTPSDNCYMRVQQKNTSGAAYFGDSAIVLRSARGHKGTVYSAQFDYIDSTIVSAGQDGQGLIWYARNRIGELFNSLNGFPGAMRMYYATYNSRGDIIYGGENNRFNVGAVYAPLPPTITTTLPGMFLSAFGNAAIRHIHANPLNPNRILVTSQSFLGGIYIHDMSLPGTDEQKFIIRLPLSEGSLVNNARYTPRLTIQNQTVSGVIGTLNGVADGVRLWLFSGDERNVGQPIRWTSTFRPVYADAISDPNHPGNLRIAVACTDSRVRFLTIVSDNGGIRLEQDMTVGEIAHQAPITMLSFDPTGNFLVTASGNQSFIWQLGQSSQLQTVLNSPAKRLHKANINTAFFSTDGSRIVTASQDTDTNVVVWFVREKLPLQEDRSDNLWRIVRPHLVANDIDVGKAIVGNDKDTTHLVLTNPDLYAVPITKVWLKKTNSPFSIVSGGAPFTVNAATPPRLGLYNIEFRFHPLVEGRVADNTDSVFFQTISGDTLRAKISGEGVFQRIQVVPQPIDWRERFVSIGYDTVQAVIRNISPIAVNLNVPTAPNISGTFIPPFSVLGVIVSPRSTMSGGIITLAAGDSIIVNLRFTPPYLGLIGAPLQFITNQPGEPPTVQLLGTGVQDGPRLSSTLSATPFVQTLCTASSPLSIPLPNTGTQALVIDSIRVVDVAGAISRDFQNLTQTPLTIQVNDIGSQSARIRFTPQAAGTTFATLVIYSNSINGTARIPLQGRLEKPALVFSTRTVVTLPVDAGATTVANIQVRNAGNLSSSWYLIPSLTQKQYYRFVSQPASAVLTSNATASLQFTFLGGRAGVTYQDIAIIENRNLDNTDCLSDTIVLSTTVKSAPRLTSPIQSVVLSTCSSSATINIPITNTGTTPASLSYVIEPPTRLVSRLVTTATIGTGETFTVQVILDTLARAGVIPPFSLVVREATTASVTVPISITKHDVVSIDLIPPSVAFPVLDAGVATSAIVIIRNRSNQTLTIPAQASNRTPEFRLETPSQSIPPYGEVAARLIFTGAAAGLSFVDSFPFAVSVAGVSGCAISSTLLVSASTLPLSTADLVFTNEFAAPGDTARFKVFLRNRVRVPIGTAISDTLRYNVSLLQPLPPLPFGEVKFGERFVPLNFKVTSDNPEEPLAVLPFRAALGNDTATVLHLQKTPETRATKMVINASTGAFRLVGISRAGGLRLVISTMGTLRIVDARPNPASTELTLEFTSKDAEDYTLNLINALGIRPDSAAFPEQRFTSVSGLNTRVLDVSRLPSGIYFIQLRNGRELAARKIVIMR